jgi:cytoskeletal protein CcmA (bactofilin family)
VGLFGKPEPSKTVSASLTQTSGPSPNPSTPTPNTLIGKEALITGEITTSDVIQIEGRVEGKIKSTGLVVIGEAGRVKAEIEAENVSIRGKLEGDCTAKNRIEITNTGRVLGNLRAPLIAVAEGAVFRGSSNMTDKEGQSKEKRQAETASSKPSTGVPEELGPKLGPN